jgi:hypothetical protein
MEIKNENIKRAREIAWFYAENGHGEICLNATDLKEISKALETADKEMSAMIEFIKAYGTCQTCGNGPEPKENDFLCEQCCCDEHGLGNIYWFPNDALRAIKESDDVNPDWDAIARDADADVKKLEDGDKQRQYQQKLMK